MALHWPEQQNAHHVLTKQRLCIATSAVFVEYMYVIMLLTYTALIKSVVNTVEYMQSWKTMYAT